MPGNLKQQALSAAMVRTVNRPGMYADGNGLNLKVVSSGAKRWVQRVTIGGKRHNLGLGGYSAVPCRGKTFSIRSWWTSGSLSAHPSSTTMRLAFSKVMAGDTTLH